MRLFDPAIFDGPELFDTKERWHIRAVRLLLRWPQTLLDAMWQGDVQKRWSGPEVEDRWTEDLLGRWQDGSSEKEVP